MKLLNNTTLKLHQVNAGLIQFETNWNNRIRNFFTQLVWQEYERYRNIHEKCKLNVLRQKLLRPNVSKLNWRRQIGRVKKSWFLNNSPI